MASIMATYAQDFATKWELEAQNKRDLDIFDNLSDRLIEATDWNREINRVERLESYVIDAELDA